MHSAIYTKAYWSQVGVGLHKVAFIQAFDFYKHMGSHRCANGRDVAEEEHLHVRFGSVLVRLKRLRGASNYAFDTCSEGIHR